VYLWLKWGPSGISSIRFLGLIALFGLSLPNFGLHDFISYNRSLGAPLQILSNGRYPSCLHRVVTNKTHPRTSIALFFSPAIDAHISPAAALVDEEHPPRYREFTYVEYLKNFYQNGGPNKKVILSRFQSEDKQVDGLNCN
jgi:hypothetical protein